MQYAHILRPVTNTTKMDFYFIYLGQPERNLTVNENKCSILHYIQRLLAGTVTDIIFILF